MENEKMWRSSSNRRNLSFQTAGPIWNARIAEAKIPTSGTNSRIKSTSFGIVLCGSVHYRLDLGCSVK